MRAKTQERAQENRGKLAAETKGGRIYLTGNEETGVMRVRNSEAVVGVKEKLDAENREEEA